MLKVNGVNHGLTALNQAEESTRYTNGLVVQKKGKRYQIVLFVAIDLARCEEIGLAALLSAIVYRIGDCLC